MQTVIKLRSGKILDIEDVNDIISNAIFAAMPEGDISDFVQTFIEDYVEKGYITHGHRSDLEALLVPVAKKMLADVKRYYDTVMVPKLDAHKWPEYSF